MHCSHCGGQISDETAFCPSCGTSIAFDMTDQGPRWVSYRGTHVSLRMVDEFRYQIAVRIEAETHRVGEVRSDDMGRSWGFRAFGRGGYILEGACCDLDDGIRSIMRALWGHGLD